MSTDFSRLVLPSLHKLLPYEPGKPIDELKRELGVEDVIKLASNENPLGPSDRVKQAIDAALPELARYPDGAGFRLKQKLAEHLQLAPATITLGNGSNDVLELLARALLGPGTNAVVSAHAFVVYPLAVMAQAAELRTAPARDWGHDLEAMAALVDEHTRLVFIANPNNPTGTWLTLDEIDAFMARVPGHVIVILDEAYAEYVNKPGYGSGLELLARYPNLVVARTFSKAYGLAALRVGYAVSDSTLADFLNRLRQPFNVNSLAMVAAEAALDDAEYLQHSIATNLAGMAQLEAGFERLNLDYIPSAGNFIAVAVPGRASELYGKLLAEGVIVRPVGGYGMPDHLRISIGLEDENRRFLETLERLLAEEGANGAAT